MRKKSERKTKETKTSPEKPRRSSRGSRRRKKSSSSEAESDAVEVESSEEEVVQEKKRKSRSNVDSENDKSQVEAASSRPTRHSRRQTAVEEAKTDVAKAETPEENKNENAKNSEVEEPEEKDTAQVGSTNGTESPAETAEVQNRRNSASVESSPSSAQKQRRVSEDASSEAANTNEDDTHATTKVNESADDDDVVQINAEPVELESNQNEISHLGRSESPELNYSPDRDGDSGKVDRNKEKTRSDSESEGSEGESGAGKKKSVLSSVSQVDSSKKRRTTEDTSGTGAEQEEEERRAEEDGNKQDGNDIEELKQIDNDVEEIAELVTKTSAAPLPREQRKRRWGTCRASKVEPPVVISSDYLKTIIPDVKPIAEDELKFSDGKSSGDEDEEEGEIKTPRETSDDELICDQPVILDDEKPAKKKDKSKDDSKKSEKRDKDSKEAKLSEKSKKDSKDSSRLYLTEVNNKGKQVVRKISIVSEEAKKLARPPTPSKHVPSPVLHITNLVRPFTIVQLRELLQRTGKIKDGGFWIDAIKSKCYVEFENEDQAVETRHALHDVRWPVSNPKLLHVDFAKKEDLIKAQASTSDSANRKVENILADPYSVKKAKANAPVREWDVGKPSFPDEIMIDDRSKGHRGYEEIKLERDRERDRKDRVRDRDREKERDREREHERDRDRKNRKEKYRRSRSPGSVEPPSRRRRKDDEAPAKLLDDLFCKTKASPCIYWLPLSSEQIAMKEEQRRQHIEELEKRMASNRERAKELIRERDRDRDKEKDGRRKDRSRDRDYSSHRK